MHLVDHEQERDDPVLYVVRVKPLMSMIRGRLVLAQRLASISSGNFLCAFRGVRSSGF